MKITMISGRVWEVTGSCAEFVDVTHRFHSGATVVFLNDLKTKKDKQISLQIQQIESVEE